MSESEVIDLTDGGRSEQSEVAVQSETLTPPSESAAEAEAPVLVEPGTKSGFEVHLEEFAGPFDVLLGLISKHKLEVTELALSQVTDEFCAYIKAQGSDWDLAEATSFLVVAATLLDLKAARLLPSGEVEDEEDLALLEARDLLFARLLQYRAFKEVSSVFDTMLSKNNGRVPRTVGLDPEYADLLPEVVISIGPDRLAMLAAQALTPQVNPTVSIDHIHAPAVSVAEQTAIVAEKLAKLGSTTFRGLISDVTELGVVVARFLSLLELYRQAKIALEQVAALGDLHIRWIASPDDDVVDLSSSEFDEADLSSPAAVPAGSAATAAAANENDASTATGNDDE